MWDKDRTAIVVAQLALLDCTLHLQPPTQQAPPYPGVRATRRRFMPAQCNQPAPQSGDMSPHSMVSLDPPVRRRPQNSILSRINLVHSVNRVTKKPSPGTSAHRPTGPTVLWSAGDASPLYASPVQSAGPAKRRHVDALHGIIRPVQPKWRRQVFLRTVQI